MNIGDPVIVLNGVRTDEVGIITGYTPGFHQGYLVTIGEESYPKDGNQIERLYRFVEVLDELGIEYDVVTEEGDEDVANADHTGQ